MGTFKALKNIGYPISDMVAEILDDKPANEKPAQLNDAAEWMRATFGLHCYTEQRGNKYEWMVQGNDLPDDNDGTLHNTHYQALNYALYKATTYL